MPYFSHASWPEIWEMLVALFVLLSPMLLGFLDAFGDKSQKTVSTTSVYENAFNTSTSDISSLDGSTNLTLGGESAGGGTSSIVVVAFAAVLVLGGLFLVLRRK